MAGITKPPPSSLLSQGTGAVRVVLVALGLTAYTAAMVALPVLGMLNQGAAPVEVNEPQVWETRGTRNDATTVMEADALRAYTISWEAPCPVAMRIHRWDDAAGTTGTFPMGRARSRTLLVTLPPGGYWFDADAACAWTVRVR